MGLKLDKKRPYGVVYGAHERKAAYEQDEKLFGPDGNCIDEPDTTTLSLNKPAETRARDGIR